MGPELLILAVILAGAAWLAAEHWRKILAFLRGKNAPETPEWLRHIRAKRSPLTEREWKALETAEKWAAARGLRVFPNMNLYAVVTVGGDYAERRPSWRKIQSKQVDFTFVDRDGKTSLCLELDDSSHDNASGAKRDGEKDAIFRHAGIPFVRTRDMEKALAEYRG